MIQVEVAATKRSEFGKGPMRRLREDGKTPAVLYSREVDALPLTLDTKNITRELMTIQRRNAVLTINVADGDTFSTMIREIQVDPVHDHLIHIDLQAIDIAKPREYMVPINFTGESKGVALGGAMRIVANSVQLKGSPLDIPDTVEVDVTELESGDSIDFSNIEIPAKVTMITPSDALCVEVLALAIAP
ncbi:MAG: 50S ribosomal protein L25 [Thermodesulfobacteriota bacterium]